MPGGWDKKIEDAAMDFGTDAKPQPKMKPPREEREERGPPRRKRKYHKSYYQRKKEELARKARRRWETNEGGYRDKGLQRAREKRAHLRAQQADQTFQERVESAKSERGECDVCGRTSAKTDERPCKKKLKEGGRCKGTMRCVEKPLKTKPPRHVEINGEAVWVYSSGVLAILCGKSPATVRTWIEERVVPGYSIKVSGRYWFTQAFIEAVAEACRKVLYMDGRSPLYLLRRYVRQELEDCGIQYVPLPPKDG